MLVITPVFQVPAEKLFCAWTDPAIIRQWLFKGDDSEIVRVELDLKAGGRFSIVEQTRDGTVDHFGNYVVIDRPHQLSFTLEVPRHFPGVSQVQLEFREADATTVATAATEMVFQQTGVDPQIVEGRWRRMFTQLARVFLQS
ncbi:MAG TPA: SRPBCC family protein [Bradyrhizobium sp.]|nr:SRPBCC family protein [Bradyrhizobium sp.]